VAMASRKSSRLRFSATVCVFVAFWLPTPKM
jgi:hypothetical protein